MRPAHVGDDGRVEPVDDAGPLRESRGRGAVLLALLEHHLEADADPEDGAAAREASLDDLVAAHGPQALHDRGEGPDARER